MRLELDGHALFREANIDLAVLDDRDSRLLWRQELALWRSLEQALGTSEAGLQLLKSSGAASYGIVGYLAMTSATLRNALEATVRYHDDRLSYADTKSFRRAFRRWTGTAPSEVRRVAATYT